MMTCVGVRWLIDSSQENPEQGHCSFFGEDLLECFHPP